MRLVFEKTLKTGVVFLAGAVAYQSVSFASVDTPSQLTPNESVSSAHALGDSLGSSVTQPELGNDWRSRLYIDALASWGISSSAVPSASGGNTLSQVGLGGTLGWRIDRKLWVGVTSDFRSAGMSADLLSTVSEVEGARLNLASPTVGVYLGSSLLKAEVSLFGDYRFSTLGKDALSYRLSAPRGLRMTYLYPMIDRLHAGVQGEVTSWGEKTDRGEQNPERLLQREVLWQASLTAAWVF